MFDNCYIPLKQGETSPNVNSLLNMVPRKNQAKSNFRDKSTINHYPPNQSSAVPKIFANDMLWIVSFLKHQEGAEGFTTSFFIFFFQLNVKISHLFDMFSIVYMNGNHIWTILDRYKQTDMFFLSDVISNVSRAVHYRIINCTDFCTIHNYYVQVNITFSRYSHSVNLIYSNHAPPKQEQDVVKI